MRLCGGNAKKLRRAAAAVACALAVALAAPTAAIATDVAAPLQASVDGEELANPTTAPETNTPAAFLVDRDNGQVLLAKDADSRRFPASTTKIMTALLVLERAGLDDVVTVQADDFSQLSEDSMMSGIKAGEQITVKDLLACLLLPSGNDAAYVLARHVGGTWQGFVDLMNQKAAELGCKDTHFANPCGLHDDDHYTTARDLCRIFEAALEEPTFCEIAGSATWELPATNQNPARELETTDFLIDPASDAYAGGLVTAGKTGYTLEGGKCLVASAQKDGRHLAAVTLGGANDAGYGEPTSNFYGMRDLINWGFDAWENTTVVADGDELGRVAVRLSEDGTSVGAVADGGIAAFVPTGLTLDDLTITADLPDALTAPVKKGDPLGQASVSYEGRELGTVALAAGASLAWSPVLFARDWLSVPANLAIVVGAAVAVVALIVLIVAFIRRRKSAAPGKQPKKAASGKHFKS